MQWSDEANAGFTTAKPWLKVNENYKAINVAAQEKDPSSVLNYYRRLVALRKSDEFKELFTYGRCVPAYEDTDGIMAYYREDENKRVLVVANFGSKEAQIRLDGSVKKVLLSNMTLSAGTADEAQAKEILDIDMDGEDITVALKPSYLFVGLSAIGEPFVPMKMTTAVKPVEFNGQQEADSDESMDYRYLLVPMRFNN